MKVIYTDQSLSSLVKNLTYLVEGENYSEKQIIVLKDKLLDRADGLALHPEIGQYEPYLKHLKLNHRRIVVGHFKIIYRIEGQVIYITDFFDSRQDTRKIKG